MHGLSLVRLYLLRAMYALMAVGLAVNFWPLIVDPPTLATDARTVVRALLGSLGLLCALGIRQPVAMLPLLLFELAWKLVWSLAFGLPAWRADRLDDYGAETLVLTLAGVVLLPLVIPWRHVVRAYLLAPAERWR
jgi:hypothetical protein